MHRASGRCSCSWLDQAAARGPRRPAACHGDYCETRSVSRRLLCLLETFDQERLRNALRVAVQEKKFASLYVTTCSIGRPCT